MTLSSETNKVQYSGNDSTTAFAVTYIYWADADLRVILTVDSTGVETVQTITTHYTLSGGSGATGTLTMVAAPATGETLTIKSNLDDTQTTALPLGGSFPSPTVEERFDKITRLVQQKQEELDRALKLAESSATTGLTFPEPSADEVVGWNSAGTDLINLAIADLSTSLDVLLASLASGDWLQYNGTNWVNKTTAETLGLVSPLTTKGDLMPYSTLNTRLAVGSNGQILVADSDDATGMGWVDHSNKNLLINGDFSVAQKGTSFTAATSPLNSDDTYLFDRWILLSDGDDIVDVTQGSDGSVGDFNYARLDVETVSKKFGFLQIIERKNLRGLLDAAGTVSLGFNAKVSDATKLSRIKAVVLSWDSTADAVTSDVVSAWGIEGTTPTWATNWTAENTPVDLEVTASDVRYTIEGISLDTASTANVAIFIWSDDVGTNDTLGSLLDITNVQLEVGSAATAFERRSYGQELILCHRYFYRFSNASGVAGWQVGAGNSLTTTNATIPLRTPVSMRVAPTLTEGTAANWTVSHAGSSTVVDSWGTGIVDTQGIYVRPVIGAGNMVAGNVATLFTTDTTVATIDVDAEL